MLNGFTKIFHPSISVTSLDEAISFFRDKLGFRVLMDIRGITGEEMCKEMDLPLGTKLSSAVVERDDVMKGMVELLQFDPPGNPVPPDKKHYDRGLCIITFEVMDIDKVYNELADKGIKFTMSPIVLEIPEYGSIKTAMFYGPERVWLEIVQLH